MDDEYILSKGYYRYNRTVYESENIVYNFQKCFSDSIGKRYFINIHQWNMNYIPIKSRDKYYKPYVYEYSVQLYSKNNHEAIDIEFHKEWTLDEVEKFLEAQWNSGLYDYYEKF